MKIDYTYQLIYGTVMILLHLLSSNSTTNLTEMNLLCTVAINVVTMKNKR